MAPLQPSGVASPLQLGLHEPVPPKTHGAVGVHPRSLVQEVPPPGWVPTSPGTHMQQMDMSLRLQVMMTITNNKQERTCKHSSVLSHGRKANDTDKKGE